MQRQQARPVSTATYSTALQSSIATPKTAKVMEEKEILAVNYQKHLIDKIGIGTKLIGLLLKEFHKTTTTMEQTNAKLGKLREKIAKREAEENSALPAEDLDIIELGNITQTYDALAKIHVEQKQKLVKTTYDALVKKYVEQKQKLMETGRELQKFTRDQRDPLFWIYGQGDNKEGGFYCGEEANIIYSLQFGNDLFAPKCLQSYTQTRNESENLLRKLTAVF
jgi:hypothetical protein